MPRARQPLLVVATALVSVGALVTGCSPSAGPESDAQQSAQPTAPPLVVDESPSPEVITATVIASVESQLAVRAQAVRDRDRRAFMATVDRADRGFAQQQRILFANLMTMPIRSFDYRLGEDRDVVDPTVFTPDVIEEVHLRRTDRRSVTNTVSMTFVNRSGGWLVTGERPADGTAVYGGVQSRPWGGGAIAAERRGHLLVVVDEELEERADTLADLIVREVNSDAETLGVQPRFKLLVDATSTGASTRIGGRKRTAALAVYFNVFGLSEGDLAPQLAGHRIKFHPRKVAELIDDRVLIRHELTHYLTDAADAMAPKWASEGLANYISYHPVRPAGLVLPATTYDRALSMRQRLPDSASFGSLVDYVVAQAAATYLIDEFGIRKYLRFLAGFEDGSGPVDDRAPGLLRRIYGFGMAELVRQTWAQLERFNRG